MLMQSIKNLISLSQVKDRAQNSQAEGVEIWKFVSYCPVGKKDLEF